MPSVSKKQRQLFAIAEHHPEELHAENRGLLALSHQQLHDFAATPEHDLPETASHSLTKEKVRPMEKKPKKFIKGAIKHPGSLRAAAQRRGVSTRQEAQHEKHSSNPKVRARGNLGLTLMGMNKG